MENKVKVRRQMKGMKQSELASKIGISQSALSEIETGKHAPSVYIAMRISKALSCDIYKLFIDSNNQ